MIYWKTTQLYSSSNYPLIPKLIMYLYTRVFRISFVLSDSEFKIIAGLFNLVDTIRFNS